MRKNVLILGAIAFGTALALVVGSHLSNEAMAVVVGAVCGISASIPISIALIIATSQGWGRAEPPRKEATPPAHTIVVLSPDTLNVSAAPRLLVSGGVANPNAPRDFKIIGDEDPYRW